MRKYLFILLLLYTSSCATIDPKIEYSEDIVAQDAYLFCQSNPIFKSELIKYETTNQSSTITTWITSEEKNFDTFPIDEENAIISTGLKLAYNQITK